MIKQLTFLYKACLVLVLFFLITSAADAQHRYAPKAPTAESDFELTIRNVVQTTDRILEYDIYLLDTDASQNFELATVQAGILLNSSIFAGGTMSVSLVSGTSTLNALQVPTSPTFVATVSGNPGLSLVKLASRAAPGDGNGSIISKASPGDRVIRMRLTSTVAFAANSTANLTFTSSSALNPLYATRVAQYIATVNTQLLVTPGVNALVLENPVLNPTPTAYAVTGTGSYCQSTGGLPVGVANSEVGVTYTLYKDAVAQTPTVAGTGSAFTFGNQLAGTYTVSGTNGGGTTSMTGSAVITETPSVAASVTIGVSQNNICSGTSVTFTATPVGGGTTPTYQWYKNTVAVSTASTYTYTALNGDVVYVVMTSNAPCATGSPATSGSITMVVSTQLTPAVSIVANANPVTAGATVTFTPTPVNGGTPTYQWYVNGVSAGSGATYAFVPVNGDQVYVVMTTSLSCVTSATATSNTITVTVNASVPATSTWTGTISSDWFNAGNWNNGVPGAITLVTIPGGLTNYPTLLSVTSIAGITINSGASFIGSEFLTTGTALVKRDIVNSDFHFVSSPVASTTFGSVFPLNQTQVWARAYNETSGDWDNLAIANSLAVGKGYSVQMTQAQTALFTGTLNSSAVTSTLAKLNPSSDANRVGWNLLGNPFTSAIDWDLTNHSSIDGSVYVWTGTQYVSWNGTVGALTNGIIPAQNGFFARTTVNGASFTVPLASRVHSATGFYKSLELNMLSLTVDGNSYSDQTFVHFNDQATAGFDNQYDAYKLFGNANAPQLYSMITGDVLSINELPMAGNQVVNLGFKCNTSGIYTVSALGTESFSSAVPVYLKDIKLNVIQDLKLNPVYAFSYASGESENRFQLLFLETTGIHEADTYGIQIFSTEKTVVIDNTQGLTGVAGIYDMSGRELYSGVLSSQTRTFIPMQVAIGAYVVKVLTAKGPVVAKLIIR